MTGTGWGYYMQGGEGTQEIELLGSQLSVAIGCTVHYPAFGKRIYECRCGVLFPTFSVQAAFEKKDWKPILEHHKTAWRPAK
jgi:hypothetical protein